MKISGVIITFNEEEKLEKCLNSLQSVCDELLVVDSFSTDRTKAIAEKMGARVIQRPFLGHIEQKNFAKEQAAGPWVLSLDADEALSPELITSIQKLKS